MKLCRRKLLHLAAGAAALPVAARAQRPVIPVIGFLARGANGPNRLGPSFYRGLKETGYVEGQNVAIEYRGGPPNRLTELATELVLQQVAVILTSSDGAAQAAKRATSTIPIVFFSIGSDPVSLGLVASISRPGGNVTGVGYGRTETAAKRLDLLCQLVPRATTVAYLSSGPSLSFEEEKDKLVAAASELGRELIVIVCRSNDELGRSFTAMVERGVGALTLGFIPGVREDAVVSFAAQYKIPAIYYQRSFALRGGLMSYNAGIADQGRQAAGLVGQILNGAMPTDLPVRKSAKFDFAINLKTAKQLGLEIPIHLQILANELIE
jgi:putative tryptophan/tyrosine transport system substrate-binding protein